ncbi:hypothetical protein AX16_010882, partial [Volvariella volvacea WC 439]
CNWSSSSQVLDCMGLERSCMEKCARRLTQGRSDMRQCEEHQNVLHRPQEGLAEGHLRYQSISDKYIGMKWGNVAMGFSEGVDSALNVGSLSSI